MSLIVIIYTNTPRIGILEDWKSDTTANGGTGKRVTTPAYDVLASAYHFRSIVIQDCMHSQHALFLTALLGRSYQIPYLLLFVVRKNDIVFQKQPDLLIHTWHTMWLTPAAIPAAIIQRRMHGM